MGTAPLATRRVSDNACLSEIQTAFSTGRWRPHWRQPARLAPPPGKRTALERPGRAAAARGGNTHNMESIPSSSLLTLQVHGFCPIAEQPAQAIRGTREDAPNMATTSFPLVRS
jgi:hypothetical protein